MTFEADNLSCSIKLYRSVDCYEVKLTGLKTAAGQDRPAYQVTLSSRLDFNKIGARSIGRAIPTGDS